MRTVVQIQENEPKGVEKERLTLAGNDKRSVADLKTAVRCCL